MTEKNAKSEDFKTIAKAIREPNKPEVGQPKLKPKISRDLHTLRIKRGDN